MKTSRIFIVFLGVVLTGFIYSSAAIAQGAPKLLTIYQDIEQLHDEGKLSEADEKIQNSLEENREQLSEKQIEGLEFELERSARIRRDYSLTEDRLKEILARRIKDFSDEDFERWEEEGRFDFKVINGEKRYVGASASNLFWRYEDIRARRTSPRSAEHDQFLWEHYQDIKEAFKQPAQSTVLPTRYKMKMTITVDPGVVPKGETIRCWMPYPQQRESQANVQLLASTPEVKWINAPRYPMRSLYFEQPSQGDEPTVFEAEYTMTGWARHNPIDPSRVMPVTANPLWTRAFTLEQAPHVMSGPEMEHLANQITQGESNPYFMARKIYDWIKDNIQYSYAREYSTLRNISQYCYYNRYGDCGQQALLFITLCRAKRIPARWQSGWMLHPTVVNLHDWTEIYLEPYGWAPVDVNFAQLIEQNYESLSRRQKDELQDFYFGGLDAYRLIVNSAHGYPHYPEKKSFRSDTVDFQRGELEAMGKNIYFSDFSYNLDVEYLDDAAQEMAEEEKKPQGPAKPGMAR